MKHTETMDFRWTDGNGPGPGYFDGAGELQGLLKAMFAGGTLIGMKPFGGFGMLGSLKGSASGILRASLMSNSEITSFFLI